MAVAAETLERLRCGVDGEIRSGGRSFRDRWNLWGMLGRIGDLTGAPPSVVGRVGDRPVKVRFEKGGRARSRPPRRVEGLPPARFPNGVFLPKRAT